MNLKKFWIPAFAGMTFLLGMTLLPVTVKAEPTSYFLEDKIGRGFETKIYVIGEEEEKTQVQQALYGSVDRARDLWQKLDTRNSRSEIAELNKKQRKGSYPASPEVVAAVAEAVQLNKMVKGAFPQFQGISADTHKNTIRLGQDGIQIELDDLMEGLLADAVADTLNKLGYSNCMVKISDTYVSRGRKMQDPWKFPSMLPGSNASAKRVLFYKAPLEAGGATWSGNSPGKESSDFSSVTVYAERGITAQGLAGAFYRLGMKDSRTFLEKNKKVRAIFIDKSNKITHIPQRPKITG